MFIKVANMQYATGIIKQITDKGGVVQAKRNWLKCNIFGEHKTANFGAVFVDLEEDTDAEIEQKSCDFFEKTLTAQQFICEVTDI